MFPRILSLLAAGFFWAVPLHAQTDTTAEVQSGELVWRDPSCYFFVLKLDEKYSLFEFLGGPSPLVGHTFEGRLNAFGTRKIENKTEGKPTMVYSETFELSKSQMEKKIPKFCKKRKEFEELSG